MLEDASVKLSTVASSLTALSGWAMIEGETDPRALADLAQGKMPAKIPALMEALTDTSSRRRAWPAPQPPHATARTGQPVRAHRR